MFFPIILLFLGISHVIAMDPNNMNSPIQEEDFRTESLAMIKVTQSHKSISPRLPLVQIWFNDLYPQEPSTVMISNVNTMRSNSIVLDQMPSDSERAALAGACTKLLFNKRTSSEKIKVVLNKNSFDQNRNNYFCPQCSQKNDSFIEASNHMITKHTDPNRFIITPLNKDSDLLFDCNFPGCMQKFTEKNIDLHKFECHTKKTSCNYCKFDFRNKENLLKHIGYFHNDLLYQCHICLLIIKNKYTFDAHLKDHNKKPSEYSGSFYFAHLAQVHKMSERLKKNHSPE